MSWPRIAIAVMCVAATLGFGCSNDDSSSLSATFTASATAPTPNLVKLIQKTVSGTTVVVQAVIYGPTTSQDIYSFAFDVSIADPTVVKFVTGSAVAGTALQASGGQTISAIADLGTLGGGGVDNSRVVVGVTKTGGGAGNGVAGASAVVVELNFQALKAGTTTLTLTGNPTPQALDHNGTPIASITFDAASATMVGVSTGGGGY
jgi:hypothetical protein